MNRNEMLSRLANEPFDLLVIGGGISGAGLAREAALRGKKVGLVERGDFGGGTSSRSGKMIIGGLRYLLNGAFHLVRKGIRERDWLVSAAPHLVEWRPYLFPVWAGDPDPLWKIRLGLTLYDLIGAGGPRQVHQHYSPSEVLFREPTLRIDGLAGAAEYWDCMTDDARLVVETLQVAARAGASLANYAEVTGFEKKEGEIQGVTVHDRLTDRRFSIRADKVLVAAGPWTDHLRRLDEPAAPPLLRLVKGSFIVLPHDRLPIGRNVTLRAPDGRMTFAVPFGGQTYIGTTEVDHRGSLDALSITHAEVAYLVAAVQKAFPGLQLCEEHIISTWAGLRPLVGSRPGQNPSQVKRDFTIQTNRSGLAILAGGKLTGFRAMAQEVLDRLFPANGGSNPAPPVPFPGAAGDQPTTSELATLAKLSNLPLSIMQDRIARYGSRVRDLAAELPDGGKGLEGWARAQARYAVKHEMAQKLVDVLWRRTGSMITQPGNALAEAESVVQEMATLLGWDTSRVQMELGEYQAEVGRMWTWREHDPKLTSAPVTSVEEVITA